VKPPERPGKRGRSARRQGERKRRQVRTVEIRKELSERTVECLPNLSALQRRRCRADRYLSRDVNWIEGDAGSLLAVVEGVSIDREKGGKGKRTNAVGEDLAVQVVLDLLDDQRHPRAEVLRRETALDHSLLLHEDLRKATEKVSVGKSRKADGRTDVIRNVVHHIFTEDGRSEVGVGGFSADGLRRRVEDEVGPVRSESDDDLWTRGA
jgi:hypothetical protein